MYSSEYQLWNWYYILSLIKIICMLFWKEVLNSFMWSYLFNNNLNPKIYIKVSFLPIFEVYKIVYIIVVIRNVFNVLQNVRLLYVLYTVSQKYCLHPFYTNMNLLAINPSPSSVLRLMTLLSTCSGQWPQAMCHLLKEFCHYVMIRCWVLYLYFLKLFC